MANEHFVNAATACILNGQHLLEDAEFLEYSEPPSTSFALSIIAQEEFAKAFLLLLVARGVIPWNRFIYRATRDHTCKQLLGIVMEHLNPDTDEFLKRINESNTKNKEVFGLLDALQETDNAEQRQEIWKKLDINRSQEHFPATVADAINILRHEKIGRWESFFAWDEEPQYDPTAKMTSEGSIDREKQDALYVRLSRAGEVVGSPLVRADTAKDALDRAKRLGDLVEQLAEGNTGGLSDYEKVESAFKALFENLSHQTRPKIQEE